MHCEACRAHAQLGAQLEWISRINRVGWSKVHKYQQAGTQAASVALWESGGKVRNVTHTLLLHTRQAIRALFRVVYRTAKRRGMLRDVVGDAEAVELNGASIINTYRSLVSVIGILEHVAVDVRRRGGHNVLPSPPFLLSPLTLAPVGLQRTRRCRMCDIPSPIR